LLLEALVIHAAASWGWHIVYTLWMRLMLRKDPPSFPLLIIGVTRESRALIERLNRNRSPIKPVAILDVAGSKETTIDGVPVRGRLNKLEEVLEHDHITHVIQCSDLDQSLNLLSACRNRGITYMLLPSVLGIVEKDEQIESLEGMPVTVVRPS
jgi:FlaA1/EpsC-like NDP-sugar epimerase